jgi:tol-pal system protein YbgF
VRPSDVYQQAYLDFSKGNYILAMAGFSEFLRLDPTSDLADNAQFWIGEAYYSQKQFERAVQEYQKVYINYPKGDKVPAALFKEALAHLELKQQTLAQARLQYLVEQFPHSEEAALARDRLARLKSQR